MLRNREFESWSDRSFLLRALALQVLPALALFVGLYLIAHREVTADVANYYLPPTRLTLGGQIPLRDFQSSEAPLFPFVGAAIISVWNSGKAFVLVDIPLNALTLILWHAIASRHAGQKSARESSILFASSGNLLVHVLLGSNQVWIAACFAGSAWLLVRGRSGRAGLLQGIAVGTIKLLTLLYWPVFWICAPRRFRWLMGAIPVAVLIYGVFGLLGLDLITPLRAEKDAITSGNLPYLLEPLVGLTGLLRNRIFDGLAFLGLLATIAWLYMRARCLPAEERPKLVSAGIALLGVVFMLVSKRSFAYYSVFFMYPATLMVVRGMAGRGAQIAFLLVFNVLLSVESSLWFHLKAFGATDVSLSAWLQAPDRHSAFGMILIEVALIACYAWVLVLSVRCVEYTRHQVGMRAATQMS
jgi:hypothetical protein